MKRVHKFSSVASGALLLFLSSLSLPAAVVMVTLTLNGTHLTAWPPPEAIQCNDPGITDRVRKVFTEIEPPQFKPTGVPTDSVPPAPYTNGTLRTALASVLGDVSLQMTGFNLPPGGNLLTLTVVARQTGPAPLACVVVSRLVLSPGHRPFQCTLGELADNSNVQTAALAAGVPMAILQPAAAQRGIVIAFAGTPSAGWLDVPRGMPQDIDGVAQLGALPLAALADLQELPLSQAINNSRTNELGPELPQAWDLVHGFYFTLGLPATNLDLVSLTPWTSSAGASYNLLVLAGFDPPEQFDTEVTHFYYGSSTLHPIADLKTVAGADDAARVQSDIDAVEVQARQIVHRYLHKGQFPSQRDVDEMQMELGRITHVAASAVSSTAGAVKVEITYQPSTYQATASAGYGSPSGLTAGLSYNSKNLNFPNDEVSASVSGGPDAYAISSGYQAAVTRSKDGAWSVNIGPHGEYDQLSKIHLDNPDGPYIHQDTVSAGCSVGLAYDSGNLLPSYAPKLPSGEIFHQTGSVTLDTYFRSVWARGPSIYLGSQPDMDGPGATLKGTWSDESSLGAAKASWGQFDFSATGDLAAQDRADRDNSLYFGSDGNLTATTWFAWKNPKDFFVRGIVGGGHVTGGAPNFDEEKLGGDDIDRGLLSGDVIGRTTLYETAEFGVSVGTWLDGDTLKSVKDAGFDLGSLYTKALVDHGDAWSRPVLPGIRTLSGDSTSYGGGLEYDQMAGGHLVEFFAGYAWSPQSGRDGRVFTGASIQF